MSTFKVSKKQIHTDVRSSIIARHESKIHEIESERKNLKSYKEELESLKKDSSKIDEITNLTDKIKNIESDRILVDYLFNAMDFIKNIDNIKDGDIVIIGWSDIGRFRLATKNNSWNSFVPNHENNYTDMENISNQTIMELCVNRLSDVYIDEINIWINFIKKTIKNFKIINWSTFNQGKIDGIFVKEIEQITNETNGVIKDAHFSEKGQKQLSEILLIKINGKLI